MFWPKFWMTLPICDHDAADWGLTSRKMGNYAHTALCSSRFRQTFDFIDGTTTVIKNTNTLIIYPVETAKYTCSL
jgi:hypothetical protein